MQHQQEEEDAEMSSEREDEDPSPDEVKAQMTALLSGASSKKKREGDSEDYRALKRRCVDVASGEGHKPSEVFSLQEARDWLYVAIDLNVAPCAVKQLLGLYLRRSSEEVWKSSFSIEGPPNEDSPSRMERLEIRRHRLETLVSAFRKVCDHPKFYGMDLLSGFVHALQEEEKQDKESLQEAVTNTKEDPDTLLLTLVSWHRNRSLLQACSDVAVVEAENNDRNHSIQSVVQWLITIQPESLDHHPDLEGYFPIHVACMGPSDPTVVRELLQARPSTASLPRENKYAKVLPLYVACTNPFEYAFKKIPPDFKFPDFIAPSLEVVQMLLEAFPDASQNRVGRDSPPIFRFLSWEWHNCQIESQEDRERLGTVARKLLSPYLPTLIQDKEESKLLDRAFKAPGEIMKEILRVCPEGIHYLVGNRCAWRTPNEAECLRMVMETSPLTATVQNDDDGLLPLQRVWKAYEGYCLVHDHLFDDEFHDQVHDDLPFNDEDGPEWPATGDECETYVNAALSCVQEVAKFYPEAMFLMHRDRDGVPWGPYVDEAKREKLLLAAYPNGFLASDDASCAVNGITVMDRLPVHIACANLAPEAMLDFIYRSCPDCFDRQDSEGNSPLHLACSANMSLSTFRHVEKASIVHAVGFLLRRNGHFLSKPNKAGLTPIGLACTNITCLPDVLYLLLRETPSVLLPK